MVQREWDEPVEEQDDDELAEREAQGEDPYSPERGFDDPEALDEADED